MSTIGWLSPESTFSPELGRIYRMDELANGEPLEADLFIVDGRNPEYASRAVETVRRHPLAKVYCSPLVLLTNGEPPTKINDKADVSLSLLEADKIKVQRLQEQFLPVQDRIDAIPDSRTFPDENVALKVLRFLYTRNRTVVPVRGVWKMQGFHFPRLEPFFSSEQINLFGTLEFLESHGLLEGEFFDRAHFCSRCGCAFLNFREVCPHCGSADLVADDLIHHFRCAYMGPKEEFEQAAEGKGLRCPKCDRWLKHIGVDYDKPATVYSCNDCDHRFQEPEVNTICYNCEKSSRPEEMNRRTIKQYKMTALAEHAVVHGFDSLFSNLLGLQLHTIDLETFKTILDLEIRRIRRYKKTESTLIVYHVNDLESMYITLGDKARSIFEELSQIILGILRSSDVTTMVNNSTFLSLLVETTGKGAEQAIRRLVEQTTALLQSNVDKNIRIETHALPVLPEDESAELVERMMRYVVTR